jgi:hypothetical protein
VDWIKALTELIKALAHFAWPVLVGLIVWWLRKEIRTELAALIARISKLKAFGVEVETSRLLSEVKETWIGLNPSVANEAQLDPTLRRIRAFSAAWGYNGFIMTNLFGLVSTNSDRLYAEVEPVGPENDRCILGAAQETGR